MFSAPTAPSAIFIAGIVMQYTPIQWDADNLLVVGTGLLGWLLNIVLVLCSGPL